MITRSKIYSAVAVGSVAVLPLMSIAAPTAHNTKFDGILKTVEGTLNIVIGLLAILATVAFIWGVITFVLSASDSGKRAEGRQMMINGLIGLAVIAAAWAGAQLIINYIFGTDAPTGVQKLIQPPGQ